MSLALANVVVSVLTLLVVAAAALAALVQLRHLRSANNLTGLLAIMHDWDDPEFRAARAFLANELPVRLHDPVFQQQLREGGSDRAVHRELIVADWYEQLGSYLKHGLIDERVFLDVSWTSVLGAWTACLPAIEIMRNTRGDNFYENFEYAAVRAAQFGERHGNRMYPRGTPRWRDLPTRPSSPAASGARASENAPSS